MNIPQHLREFQAITRSATDRALFLALLTSRDRKLPLPLRLLAFVIVEPWRPATLVVCAI